MSVTAKLVKLFPWQQREPAWMKYSALCKLDDLDVTQDPVRPELDLEFRTSYQREIYGLKHQDNVLGVICLAYTSEVPRSITELDLMSQITYLRRFAPLKETRERIAVGYTVWSNRAGAGRIIMDKVVSQMRSRQEVDRLVTLSPLTPGATHYHIRNGAKLINIGMTSHNFEYDIGGDMSRLEKLADEFTEDEAEAMLGLLLQRSNENESIPIVLCWVRSCPLRREDVMNSLEGELF